MFRFVFSAEFTEDAKLRPTFVKVPKLPGEGYFHTTITVDYENNINEDEWMELGTGLALHYQLGKDLKEPHHFSKGILEVYDKKGDIIEKWTLEEMYPTYMDFGDLDYSTSSECKITVHWRYNKCTHEIFKHHTLLEMTKPPKKQKRNVKCTCGAPFIENAPTCNCSIKHAFLGIVVIVGLVYGLIWLLG